MQITIFQVKKYAAFTIAAILPFIAFIFALLQWGLMWGLIFFAVVIILSIFIGCKLIAHPLLALLEKKGLLVLTLDSTGTIDPYIAKVENPYLIVKTRKGLKSSIFDRKILHYLATPKEAKITKEDDQIKIALPKEQTKTTFQFQHFPTLIYNKQLETFLTKDQLAKLETDTFVQHLVLYLNKKIEELTTSVRDFARYVVEETRPKKGLLGGRWLWFVIIAIVIIVIVALIAPMFLQMFGQAAQSVAGTLPPHAVNPKG